MGALAGVLSLPESEVMAAFYASIGLGFCFVHLASSEAVDRAVIDMSAWTQFEKTAWSPHIFFFSGAILNGASFYARMTAPALGMEEDPATGSAAGVLAAALGARSTSDGEPFEIHITQGVSIGRPSEIRANARSARTPFRRAAPFAINGPSSPHVFAATSRLRGFGLTAPLDRWV